MGNDEDAPQRPLMRRVLVALIRLVELLAFAMVGGLCNRARGGWYVGSGRPHEGVPAADKRWGWWW